MTRAEFAAAAASVAFVPATPRARLATRAERTDYAEPSGISDVARVLDELDRRGAPIARGSIGTTGEGRAIPYAVASRPIVRAPEEARALARPIVLVRAAADAGKVEGTDATLAMLRDLCVSTQKTLLEEIVLIVLPLFNVDGSERSGPVAANAPMQNGPPFVGTRTNAAGIDLDADFVVAAAPETRALLAFVDAWRPDAFVDLSSDGASFVAFGATYAPALHPAAATAGAFVRDEMLHAVRAEMRTAFEIETSTCGRFGRDAPLPEPPPPGDAGYGWFAGDHRPRTCVNAMGVRGIPAIRVAAYAHDAFERRIFTTRASVETILGFCSDRAARVRAVAAAGARWNGGGVPIRAALAGTPA
ncbi:MAG: hypothetical protein IAI48_17325, partial [Candidatus Eremiobacteraeota bacterium]|nr:hypothetical protein [Candidatus Eremiobacteraeota bacterium]